MVFMERQERLRNRGLVFLACIFFSCKHAPDKITSDDDNLVRLKGIYYYDGNPYSGKLIEVDSQNNCTGEIELIDGLKHGRSVYYFQDGSIKRTAEYKKGVYHGLVVQYFENGTMFSRFNYVNGQEQGRQQMWKSDGRLKVNYDVIDGRKYGLTGVKNCLNVYEDTVGFH